MTNNDDMIDLFEQRLCEYTGSPYALVVDRCTNAIVLCLEYFKQKNDPYHIPNQTYMSVPMTMINYGYRVELSSIPWQGHYQIGRSNIYDYAVGFEKNMYKAGQIQCISFQQKKRLKIGKGGAILLDDHNMYKKLKRMRHDGRTTHLGTSQDIINNPNDILIGYHMNMTPDEAAKGLLLLNQIDEQYQLGSYKDYPNLAVLPCFKEYLQ